VVFGVGVGVMVLCSKVVVVFLVFSVVVVLVVAVGGFVMMIKNLVGLYE